MGAGCFDVLPHWPKAARHSQCPLTPGTRKLGPGNGGIGPEQQPPPLQVSLHNWLHDLLPPLRAVDVARSKHCTVPISEMGDRHPQAGKQPPPLWTGPGCGEMVYTGIIRIMTGKRNNPRQIGALMNFAPCHRQLID